MTSSELLPLVTRSSSDSIAASERLLSDSVPVPPDSVVQLPHQPHPQQQQPTHGRRPVSLQLPIGLSCFILCTAASGYGAGMLRTAWWVQLLVWLSAVGSCALLLAVNQTDPGALQCGTTTGVALPQISHSVVLLTPLPRSRSGAPPRLCNCFA